MSGSVVITGQPISARTPISQLIGTEPIPLGLPGDPSTTPNQLKAFIANSVMPINEQVTAGTFTIDAATAADMSTFQPVTLFEHALGAPLINSDYYEISSTVLSRLSTPTHTLPYVTGQYTQGNLQALGYSSFLAAGMVDFRMPISGVGNTPPYVQDEYIRGTFINAGFASNPVALITNPVDVTTSQSESGADVLYDNLGLNAWTLQFNYITKLGVNGAANGMCLQCQLVWALPANAVAPSGLSLEGTHSWSLMIRKYRTGIPEPTAPVAHSVLLGWYPKMSQTRGVAPGIEVAYSALVRDTSQGITTNLVVNGNLHVVVTPYQYALLGSTTWVDDLNTQLVAQGVDLALSQVDIGDGMYRLYANSPRGSVTTLSFPQNPSANARGSDKSNTAEMLLNLEEHAYTLP
jgi:hypothetical protein